MRGAAEVRQRQVKADGTVALSWCAILSCVELGHEFEADHQECFEALVEFLVLCWYRLGCDGDAMLLGELLETKCESGVASISSPLARTTADLLLQVRTDVAVKPQILWPCMRYYPISMSMDSTRSLDFAFQSPKSLAKWFLISKSTLPSHEMH